MDKMVFTAHDFDLFINYLAKKIVENLDLKISVPDDLKPLTWMNLKELQEYLPDKPARMTIYAWVQQGKIPVQKGGKKLTFLRSEIDEWLLNGRQIVSKSSIKLKQKS